MEYSLKSIIDEALMHDSSSCHIIPDAACLPNYRHYTFSVSSIPEYLDVVKLLNSHKWANSDTMVFRGMSDYKWDLIPSIARSDSRDESAEHEMVNEFLTLRPEAFQDLHSNFELLAKMQHYGLPTRLLDFTTNPLIALYFACEKNDSKSARVICCNAFLSYIDNEIIEALSSSYLPYSLENLKIEDLLLGTRVSAYEYISKLYLAEDYRLLFAKPRYWNQRIKNQSAIFLIYPNKLFDNLGKICYYQKIYGLDKEITGMENTEENRNRILEVARRESIESIYPIYSPPDFYKPKHMDVPMLDFTVTHQSMRSLFSQYERDNIRKVNTDGFTPYTEYGAVSFDRRFLIVDQIQGIDSKSLENQFCSVVIDAKHKSCIREELGNIGIDKAFVYPELEYTAEKIKKKYLFE